MQKIILSEFLNQADKRGRRSGRSMKLAQRSAEIILIPKQLRMDWVDVMALDPSIVPMAFRIACVIGTHFGNKSGLTYISRETIARVAGVDLSTAKRAIVQLEAAGYIIVRRRLVGTRNDGSVVYGRRGDANEYLPACNALQVSATDRGQRLVALTVEWWEQRKAKKRGTDDPLPDDKRGTDDPLKSDERGSFRGRKRVTGAPPPLSLSSRENSSRGREALPAHTLGAFGEHLRDLIGLGDFASWFASGKVRIESEIGDTVTLSAPSVFVRTQILERYKLKLERALQRARPETAVVHVVVRQSRGDL
jgi:hypothetical protein